MFVNDDILNHTYKLYKYDTRRGCYKLVYSDECKSKQDCRTFPHPNPNFRIKIAPEEHATYIVTLYSDGRTVNVTPKLISTVQYNSLHSQNRTWSIVFLTTIFILLLLNVYLRNFYNRKYIRTISCTC